MSLIICNRCGRTTNTALCDWIDDISSGKASRCYAAWDEINQCWVKGCVYDDPDVDSFYTDFALKQISKSLKE